MSGGLEKILVIEADESSRQRLAALLAQAGYEVSASGPGQTTVQAVVAFAPDLVVVHAEPPQLDCCFLVTELKSAPATRGIRVILLASGGAAERTRGLDLGADDVVSLPWEPAELLSRVRVQLRTRHVEAESQDKVRFIEEGQGSAQATAQALAVTEKISRQAFSLTHAVRAGVVALVLVVVVTGAVFFLFYRHAQSETSRASALIAQMERGLAREQELIERSRKMREELEGTGAGSLEQQRRALTQQVEELRARMGEAQSGEVGALRRQLEETSTHLRRLENEATVAQTIIRSYASSVCLLHVTVAFREQASGRRLRYAGLNPQGEPIQDSEGNPIMNVEGRGPEAVVHVFGTGFLIAPGERILTNRHVVEPWWKDEQLSALFEQGLEPVVAEMNAYFPGDNRAWPVRVHKLSAEVDLAVVQGDLANLRRKAPKLNGGSDAAVTGRPVVLLGYATGLDAILARAGEETVRVIAVSSGGNPKQIIAELARRDLVRPIVTQGHIGDILTDKIVYDAQTTSGGSGGPLFNVRGEIIGVNYAVVRGFGGSNFAIPIRYAEPLLGR